MGSGAVAWTLKDFQNYVLAAGFAVSFISGIKLVYAFGAKASKHSQFVRDFTRLEKKLRADNSEKTLAKVAQERLELEAAEPPVKHALNVLCHNELAQAMGYRDEEMYTVGFFKRWTANCFGWAGCRFRKSAPSKNHPRLDTALPENR